MIRSGVPRKSNQVVFRVPSILNKLDIRAYLEGVYPGLKIDEIVTFNFLSKTTCGGRRTKPAYKNAIVTLSNETVGGAVFRYPDPPAEETLKLPIADRNAHARVHPLRASPEPVPRR